MESGNTFSLLIEAYRALGEKKYSQAAVILEAAARLDWGDPYPSFMLAVAYLYSDKFDRAEGVMKQLSLKYPSYVPSLQLQAFLNLKSARDAEHAIAIYLDLAGKARGDALAGKCLRRIRKARDFEKFQKSARLSDFVAVNPPPRSLKKNPPASGGMHRTGEGHRKAAEPDKRGGMLLTGFKISIVVYSLIVAGGIGIILFNLNISGRFFSGGGGKKVPGAGDQIDMVELGGPGYDLVQNINVKKYPEFYHSSKKILDDFRTSKMLIKQEKYNEALNILNAMNNSNASFRVKEKIDFLIKYIMNADVRNYEYLPVELIAKKPYLYQGSAVRWKGRVTNLKKKENSLEFSLLIDYREKDRFSGIADVFLGRGDGVIQNGDLVEMEGLFISAGGAGNRLQVQARNIKKFLKDQEK